MTTNIALGNLTVDQIEKRLGITFPADVYNFMKENHQPSANNIANGKWHCFDAPFTIVCGDYDTAAYIFRSVEHRSKEVKEPLTFSLQEN